MRAAVLAGLLLLGAGPAAAQTQAQAPEMLPLEAPGQSWLIDHTRSDLGGEFYRAFASAWRREARGDLVISLEEQMAQPYAHQVTVWMGNRQLALARLYPGQRDDISGLAERTVAVAAARLADWTRTGVSP